MQRSDIGSCGAQDAILRCDVNVSVRRKGEQVLGTRVEVKNMNSLSAIQKAVEYEMERQVRHLCPARVYASMQLQ